ncbi:X-linked interleukin-1 receptor accessory protein-like 2 isoform X1 [Clavelina lepadiformis]|uniref:X-linked interleukin-1 receptor accessory protein-like 2 isoform X1 n=1 Tax=Clavelina lepadiformis TaxID=159417 RepID=UPI0040428305
MKTPIIINYFSLLLFFASGNALVIDQDPSGQNCSIVDGGSINDTAFIGWPHRLSCSMFVFRSEYTIYEAYDNGYIDFESNIICQVFADNGTLLLNESTNYDDITFDDSPTIDLGIIKENENYHFWMNIIIPESEKCYGLQINVVPTPFEQISCEKFEKELESLAKSKIGKRKELSCELGHDAYPKIFSTDVTTKWFRNCSSLPANTTIRSSGKLFFPELEYDQAGIYACTVTYNGMTRFIAGYPVCVLEPPTKSPHTLQCENKVLARIGENVSLSCQLRLGVGEFSDSSFRVFWEKKENVKEVSSPKIEGSCKRNSLTNSNDRLSCSYDYERKCFLYVADESERNRKEEVIPIVLEIQSLSPSDYGTYKISSLTNNEGTELISKTVELEEDQSQVYRQAVHYAEVAVAVIVPCLGVLVFIMFLLYYKQVHVRVYIKRHFKSYELDDKEYGAYISYHYTKELDTFAQDYTSQSVHVTCEKLQELGYKIYDEHKDFSNGMRVDNLVESIKRCHRVVIILTSQYMNDDWSMRNLQQAFQTMIDSKTKIIFILVPGMKEYLKQHAMKETACRLIQAAIKLNYPIQWSNGKSFDKNFFDLQLEDAMPKIESQKSRRFSTSSSSQSAGTRMQTTGYQRCFSTNTQASELEVPNYKPNHIKLDIIEELAKPDQSDTSV